MLGGVCSHVKIIQGDSRIRAGSGQSFRPYAGHSPAREGGYGIRRCKL